MQKTQLFLVGVPIGHFDDMTFRALETLKKVDVIAAEDTRKAKKLLDHFKITGKQVLSHGAHNEHHSVDGLIALIQKGQTMAYISDAGMPGISDPGYMLVRAALQADVVFDVIPGVTAATTAVTLSALPCDKFTFHGFLPRKEGPKLRYLENLMSREETHIFYEAPHRVMDTFAALAQTCPDRLCAVGRELTKIHQECVRGTVADVYQKFQSRDDVLGEFTIILAGQSEVAEQVESLDDAILTLLAKGMKVKDIRDQLVEKSTLSKKEIYQRILSLKSDG
jgi:16S rRNA (cytidine1402-2'-O)-methyltransferase